MYKTQRAPAQDIRLALSLPRSACPRRYCWWWSTLDFEWHLTPEQGCRFVQERDRGAVPPDWRMREHPCKRAAPDSPADHYEPREPHIEADGVAPDHFSGQ